MTDSQQAEILLIDDHVGDIQLTLLALKNSLYDEKTYVVRDGSEALQYIFNKDIYKNREGKELPKLILLDLNLPKVSGIDVLRKIKSDSRTKEIPVVILTVSEDSEDARECFTLGANSYVIKSTDFAVFTISLNERVKYWLEQKQ